MREQRSRVQTAVLQQCGQLFHPQPPTGHQTAGNGLVAHAAAPFRARDAHELAAAEVIDVADAAARAEHLHGLEKGVVVASGDDDAVHAPAGGRLQDLRGDAAAAVADDVGRTVVPGGGDTVRAGADGEQPRRALELRGGARHQAHGADADDADAVAILHAGQFRAVKAGRHVHLWRKF